MRRRVFRLELSSLRESTAKSVGYHSRHIDDASGTRRYYNANSHLKRRTLNQHCNNEPLLWIGSQHALSELRRFIHSSRSRRQSSSKPTQAETSESALDSRDYLLPKINGNASFSRLIDRRSTSASAIAKSTHSLSTSSPYMDIKSTKTYEEESESSIKNNNVEDMNKTRLKINNHDMSDKMLYNFSAEDETRYVEFVESLRNQQPDNDSPVDYADGDESFRSNEYNTESLQDFMHSTAENYGLSSLELSKLLSEDLSSTPVMTPLPWLRKQWDQQSSERDYREPDYLSYTSEIARDESYETAASTPAEGAYKNFTKSAKSVVKKYLGDFETYLANSMPKFLPVLEEPENAPSEAEIVSNESYSSQQKQKERESLSSSGLPQEATTLEVEEGLRGQISQTSLQNMIYSFISFYADDSILPEAPKKRLTMIEIQLQLDQQDLSRAEVAAIARNLFKFDSSDTLVTQKLFGHMYKHGMLADIIRYALRVFEFWTAAEVTSAFILYETRDSEIAMFNIFRTCIELKQTRFARQLLADIALTPDFGRVSKSSSQDLSTMEKQLFGRTQLELSIMKTDDAKAIVALVNARSTGSTVRRNESTLTVAITQLTRLGDINAAADLFIHSVFKEPQLALSEIGQAVSQGVDLGSRLHELIAAATVQLLAANQSFDSLSFAAKFLTKSNILEIWSLLATGSRTAISWHRNVDAESCNNCDHLTAGLIETFLKRALALEDYTAFLRILQTKTTHKVHKEINPRLAAALMEKLLRQTFSESFSVIAEHRAIDTAAAIFSAQSQRVSYASLDLLLEQIANKKITGSSRKNSLYISTLLAALHRAVKVNVTREMWRQMYPVIVAGDERLQIDVVTRYFTYIGRHRAREVLKAHIDECRAVGDYNVGIVNGYMNSVMKNSRYASEEKIYILKSTILSLISHNHGNREKGIEFVTQAAKRTINRSPRVVLNNRGLFVNQLVTAIHQQWNLPSTFFQWYVQFSIVHHQFEAALQTILSGNETKFSSEVERQASSQPRLLSISQKVLKRMQYEAIVARQPRYAIEAYNIEKLLYDSHLKEETEQLVRATFALLEFETNRGIDTADFGIRYQCTKLLSLLREDFAEQWKAAVGQLLRISLIRATRDELINPGKANKRVYKLVNKRRLREALELCVASTAPKTFVPEGAWLNDLDEIYETVVSRISDPELVSMVTERYKTLTDMIKHYCGMYRWWGGDILVTSYGAKSWLLHHTNKAVQEARSQDILDDEDLRDIDAMERKYRAM
ncbi:uncharacterized protein V2V93DRAFT_396402 [Kockiozyma suomiensis]|uniref:uncharacterized protein n=1 Tax=Kockiozyma suomiensis TaxID=1337062 RepID=UPI003343D3AE